MHLQSPDGTVAQEQLIECAVQELTGLILDLIPTCSKTATGIKCAGNQGYNQCLKCSPMVKVRIGTERLNSLCEPA